MSMQRICSVLLCLLSLASWGQISVIDDFNTGGVNASGPGVFEVESGGDYDADSRGYFASNAGSSVVIDGGTATLCATTQYFTGVQWWFGYEDFTNGGVSDGFQLDFGNVNLSNANIRMMLEDDEGWFSWYDFQPSSNTAVKVPFSAFNEPNFNFTAVYNVQVLLMANGTQECLELERMSLVPQEGDLPSSAITTVDSFNLNVSLAGPNNSLYQGAGDWHGNRQIAATSSGSVVTIQGGSAELCTAGGNFTLVQYFFNYEDFTNGGISDRFVLELGNVNLGPNAIRINLEDDQGWFNWVDLTPTGNSLVEVPFSDFFETNFDFTKVYNVQIMLLGQGGAGCFEVSRFGVFPEPQPVTDSDGDGIPDDEDNCPESNTDTSIIIGAVDTAVNNVLFGDGCGMSDVIHAILEDPALNKGEKQAAVVAVANGWKKDGLISGKEKGAITSAAAKYK